MKAKTKKKRVVIIKKCLPVKLTKEELASISKQLSRENIEKEQVDNSKKEVMADFTAQIKRHESSISRLSLLISKEEEYRDVDCVWELDFKKNIKVLRRVDTKEIIDEKDITQEDRQRKLEDQTVEKKKTRKEKSKKEKK